VRLAVVGVAIAALLVFALGSPARPTVVEPVPPIRHAWIVVLENQPYERIVGSADAPYLQQLIAEHGLATDYHALGRPSQPNYIRLVAGSDLGVRDNGLHDLDANSILDQLEASGRSWRVLAEDYPGGCFAGELHENGPDSGGTYVRKHDPAISFRSISTDPLRCSRITGLSELGAAPADLNIVVPNLCHSMHDCSIGVGDAFLADLIPRIVEAPSWGPDDLLVVTFDEGDRVPAIVVSDRTPAGFRSDRRHDHYSLLRTLQEGWRLGCLRESCRADVMAEFLAAP
jgi:hypothetical protein